MNGAFESDCSDSGKPKRKSMFSTLCARKDRKNQENILLPDLRWQSQIVSLVLSGTRNEKTHLSDS